jgi:RND family efflux transporter MFP subunit
VGQQKAALDYYTIRAPFDGIVGDIPVRVGELVGPTVTLTTLDRRDEIDVLIRVPADRGPQLREGLPVEIVDRDGVVLHETHVAFVSPRADETTQTILVEAPIGAGDGLRTGQIVRARIVWEQRQSTRVPLTAVRRLSGKAFVFVVEEDPSLGTVARQRMVELGPLDAQSYPVDDGIEEGDRVIVAGVQKLRDGAPVSLEEASS